MSKRQSREYKEHPVLLRRKNSEIMNGQIISTILFVIVALKSGESAMTIEQMEKAAKGLRNSCVGKMNVDVELVAGIRRGEFPDDQNVQCYTNCIMKKLRTFKNGKVDVEAVIKQVDAMMPAERHERVKAAVRKCSNQVPDEDPCKTSYNYVKCNYNADPEMFFFP